MNIIKLFESKEIRTPWDEDEEQWYFSVVDVGEVLTDSVNAREYWFKMKKRVKSEDGFATVDNLSTVQNESYGWKNEGNRCNQYPKLISHHSIYTITQSRAF